jgi:hypothetical protein
MNPKKNFSKWKTRPSACARTTRYLALPLIAIAVFAIGAPIAHAAIGGKSQPETKVTCDGAGTAALASFGAFGALIGTDRGSRKFFEADKGATGGETKKAMDTIKDRIGQLRTRANDALSKLKPLEQHEGADRLGYMFRAMEDTHERVGDLLNHIEQGILPQYEAAMQSAQEAALKDPKFLERVIEQAVQSGDLVKKADAEGRVETARQAAYDKAKGDLRAEADRQSKLGQRRGEAVVALAPVLKTDKVDESTAATSARELCAKLSDEALLGDNYKEAINGAVARVKRCGELGVSKLEVLQEVCSMEPAAYNKQVATWEEIAKASRGTGPKLNPFAGGGGTAQERQSRSSDGDKSKRVIC